MKTLTLSAIAVALTTAVAAPAFADTSGLSANQIVQLNAALADDDHIRANFIRSQAGSDVSLSTSGSVGVPGFVIDHAENDGEFAKANFLKAKNAGEIDAPSADALARQAAVQSANAASDENGGA